MIKRVSDNIISPLGFTTEANFSSVVNGISALSLHTDVFGVSEPFFGSLLDRQKVESLFSNEIGGGKIYSIFEKLCILSAHYALIGTGIDPASADVILVVSTTKGNVDRLEKDLNSADAFISYSAEKIASYFGNPNTPLVISNACISGVCAQIAAVRKLQCRNYRYAVVIGADVLSRFIVSGFQSFKALSTEACRPYDINRNGLNLGEAAATLILERVDTTNNDDWVYIHSSIHNDANHISGPSRTGEGVYRVLEDIMKEIDTSDIAFINAHGTATNYNDEMEAIAIHRAKLDNVPLNGLKGYFGHTLGAAGILETIISMRAVESNVVLPTRGYELCGTSVKVNISSQARYSDRTTLIKILSGFGGSNAGIAYMKGGRK